MYLNLSREEKCQMRKKEIMTVRSSLNLIRTDIVIFSLLEENQIDLKAGLITKLELIKQVNESGSKVFTVLDKVLYDCEYPFIFNDDQFCTLKTIFAEIVNQLISLSEHDEMSFKQALVLLDSTFNSIFKLLKENNILDEILPLDFGKIFSGELEL